LQDLATLRARKPIEYFAKPLEGNILSENSSWETIGMEAAVTKRGLTLREAGIQIMARSLLLLAALTTPLAAQQPAKKTPAASVEVCAYGPHLYRANSYQVHGLSCQECVAGGQWVDVGGQECDAHPKNLAVKQGKPKGHLCSKDDGKYSVGAIYTGADDCSRCTGRASPDDWDTIEKMYFCEKLNPSGDVD
jgi:hypothetical protein